MFSDWLGSKHFSCFSMFVFPPVLCYSHHTPPVLMRSSSAFHVLSLLQPKIVSCVCLGPEPILYLCMEHQMVSIPNWFITWGKCQGKQSVTNTVSKYCDCHNTPSSPSSDDLQPSKKGSRNDFESRALATSDSLRHSVVVRECSCNASVNDIQPTKIEMSHCYWEQWRWRLASCLDRHFHDLNTAAHLKLITQTWQSCRGWSTAVWSSFASSLVDLFFLWRTESYWSVIVLDCALCSTNARHMVEDFDRTYKYWCVTASHV